MGPVHGAVGKELPVDASNEALGQRVGPVASHDGGLHLRAVSEALIVPAEAESAALPTPLTPAPAQDPTDG